MGPSSKRPSAFSAIFHHSLYRERKEKEFTWQLPSPLFSNVLSKVLTPLHMGLCKVGTQRAQVSHASASTWMPQGKSRRHALGRAQGTAGLYPHEVSCSTEVLSSQQQLEQNTPLCHPYNQLQSLTAEQFALEPQEMRVSLKTAIQLPMAYPEVGRGLP